MGWKAELREWTSSLLAMVYPRCCEVCGTALVRGEKFMCMECDFGLPRCMIHTDPFNTLHQRLAGHAPIERAAGYFFYHRGAPHTHLIHAAKYSGRPGVARQLAVNFANEILPDGFFADIDLIVPVPLHKSKERKRGYNQSLYIAEGLSEVTGIAVSEALVAVRSHSTQTRRNAYERWVNSTNVYQVDSTDELDGKHLLVVDDVITTGATMLACCEAIHQAAPTARISVLALGVTELQ